MSDPYQRLSAALQLAVGLFLLACFIVLVLFTFHVPFEVLFARLISESAPTAGPAPEAFERIRQQQEDVDHGEDRGPIR